METARVTAIDGAASVLPPAVGWSVDFVRVVVGGEQLRYQAVGCTRARTVVRPLSPEAAQGLLGSVPFVVRRIEQVA